MLSSATSTLEQTIVIYATPYYRRPSSRCELSTPLTFASTSDQSSLSSTLTELFGRSPASRRYIDLIYRESSLLATYSPSKADAARIQVCVCTAEASLQELRYCCVRKVGDFGDINSETGEFEFRGNIYRTPIILEKIPELKKQTFQPQTSAPLKQWLIQANTEK
jgi:hypothetical protein